MQAIAAGQSARASPLPVLLFDGECGLCQACVRFLARIDEHKRLHFAPLQSPAGQGYLRTQGLPTRDFDSLVFVPDWHDQRRGAYRLRTDGALAACAVVGGVGREIANLRALPPWLRNLFYRILARSRYALFGPARADRWTAQHFARFIA